jgi:hippurate hydrolase
MSLLDVMLPVRRDLHRLPEVGLDLPRSQERLLAALDGLGLETTLGTTSSAVTAVLRGGQPGPTVLLRADFDALPVTEKTGLPFASEQGTMHACGHDLHAAMLVGAAHLLHEQRASLKGDVVLAFQPGEEGYDGAAHMLADGVLDASGTRASAAFALHVISTQFPSGVLTTRGGPLMAAVDTLFVTVRGVGGHGSTPHRAKDPVLAAAAMVTSLQEAVTREFDVFDPVVVTTGSLHAGTAHNVSPEVARFESTVRSFTEAARAKLQEVLPRVCRGIAQAHGVEVDVELRPLFPPTVNDVTEAQWALELGRERLGDERVLELPHPVTGSEDFSRFLDAVPGAMLFLGATPPGLDPGTAPYNHAPEADFDEAGLVPGAELLAARASERLQRS